MRRLEQQAARAGHSSDPQIGLEIEDIKKEIEGYKQQVRKLEKQKQKAKPKLRCPYPGMKPFTGEYADYFYGREEEILRVLMDLNKGPNLITIIGPSGSGKSSLIFAGLLPALKKSALFEENFWRVEKIQAGLHPIEMLVEVLQGSVEQPEERIARLLDGQLVPNRKLLLIVDSLETLFTQVQSKERASFIKLLARISKIDRCKVLLLMRSDFYDDLIKSDRGLW